MLIQQALFSPSPNQPTLWNLQHSLLPSGNFSFQGTRVLVGRPHLTPTDKARPPSPLKGCQSRRISEGHKGDDFHISILWLSLRMSESCQVLAVRNIASLNFNKQTEPRVMETSRKTKFIQEKKARCLPLLAVMGVKAFKAPGACPQLSVDHVCAVPAEATRGPSALS